MKDKTLEEIQAIAFAKTSQSWFWIDGNGIYMFNTEYMTRDYMGSIDDYGSIDSFIEDIYNEEKAENIEYEEKVYSFSEWKQKVLIKK